MAQVELKNISKIYEGSDVPAMENANITVSDKEFVVFVGPSGCGKSTTLRMIAGLEDISSGELFIDGKKMNDVPPKDRDIAMVFQNYALYPHMTVYDNMAFALKMKKTPKDEIERRVRGAAKILNIEQFLNRKPKALSGGQRQRVAVGRAIVRDPKVFLFDEPLSNLDAKLRVTMRAEISALHHRLQATMIYVTHDQVEAMTMANRIVVFNVGKVQQIGAPLYLYNHPVNKFVAGFIGSPPMNFIRLQVTEEGGRIVLDEGSFKLRPADEHEQYLKTYAGKEVYFGIRPEDLSYAESAGAEGIMPLGVSVIEPLGSETTLWLRSEKGEELIAKTGPDRIFKIDEKANFTPCMKKAHYFDIKTEMSILPLPE
ncbi:MAG: sn-glycerol-3-phosphate ABC transporter ATP-binding protein UgpC [Spirochaetaceae bacterium]|jgi:multiple sugar transport system ATP-binding protein|nr:sn-glycerol-3-phosphate ABC transporter ATP-binding protein UgpC [Spirochaetaceae bacterium]GMO29173.1 MAG: sn-glycerol-3-phosphate ABC transporter ATP-binding protein UgpC [Termitinemataceae bacterium]